MPLPRLQWGLVDAVPADATGSWGFRAIVSQDGNVDLEIDRTGQQGSPLIYHLLRTQFPPSRLMRSLVSLLQCRDMRIHRKEQHELYKSPSLTVAADTLASGGYCYVAAWTTVCTVGAVAAPSEPKPGSYPDAEPFSAEAVKDGVSADRTADGTLA